MTKIGGCVGINEAIWVNNDPQIEFQNVLSLVVGGVKLENSKNWHDLLNKIELDETYFKIYKLRVINKVKNINIIEFFKSIFILTKIVLTDPDKRRSITTILIELREYPNLYSIIFNDLGYMIYIGKKNS